MANHHPLSRQEQQGIVVLWRRGKTAKQIAHELQRQPKTISEWLKRLSDAGVILIQHYKRVRNPRGYDKRQHWWSKKRKYCPHGHYMSRRNTHNQKDGTIRCRTCNNAYHRQYQQIMRSGFLDAAD